MPYGWGGGGIGMKAWENLKLRRTYELGVGFAGGEEGISLQRYAAAQRHLFRTKELKISWVFRVNAHATRALAFFSADLRVLE